MSEQGNYRTIKVSGFEIRELIKRLDTRRKVLAASFDDSLTAFAGENKKSPVEITKELCDLDNKMASARELQAKFNLAVKGVVPGFNVEVSLTYLVNYIQYAGVREGLWGAQVKKRRDRYDHSTRERSKDTEYAKPTLTPQETLGAALAASEDASTVRAMIAKLNGTVVELPVHLWLLCQHDGQFTLIR